MWYSELSIASWMAIHREVGFLKERLEQTPSKRLCRIYWLALQLKEERS